MSKRSTESKNDKNGVLKQRIGQDMVWKISQEGIQSVSIIMKIGRVFIEQKWTSIQKKPQKTHPPKKTHHPKKKTKKKKQKQKSRCMVGMLNCVLNLIRSETTYKSQYDFAFFGGSHTPTQWDDGDGSTPCNGDISGDVVQFVSKDAGELLRSVVRDQDVDSQGSACRTR